MAKKFASWERVRHFRDYPGDSESHIHKFQKFSGPELTVAQAKYHLPDRGIDTVRSVKNIMSNFTKYNCQEQGHLTLQNH